MIGDYLNHVKATDDVMQKLHRDRVNIEMVQMGEHVKQMYDRLYAEIPKISNLIQKDNSDVNQEILYVAQQVLTHQNNIESIN